MMTHEELIRWIKQCEGFREHPYFDTVGKTTIGYGRNLSDNGISTDEAEFLFLNDMRRAIKELVSLSFFQNLPSDVQCALINMNFNLGLPKLLGFKKMIAALEEHDFKTAALEALDSKWASQVGARAKDIALLIREANAKA